MRTLLDLYTGTLIGGLPLNYVTFNVLLVTCLVYALFQGGAPERIAAAIFFLACIVSRMVLSRPPATFRSLEVGLFMVDLLCMTAFVLLAVRAERFWPLWVAALQLLTVASHGVRFVDQDMILRAYAFLVIVWSYPITLLIIGGTWRHRQRLSRFGKDEAWSPLKYPLG